MVSTARNCLTAQEAPENGNEMDNGMEWIWNGKWNGMEWNGMEWTDGPEPNGPI